MQTNCDICQDQVRCPVSFNCKSVDKITGTPCNGGIACIRCFLTHFDMDKRNNLRRPFVCIKCQTPLHNNIDKNSNKYKRQRLTIYSKQELMWTELDKIQGDHRNKCQGCEYIGCSQIDLFNHMNGNCKDKNVKCPEENCNQFGKKG